MAAFVSCGSKPTARTADGAFIMVILRNVIGVKTFGTFMPVLIALALRGFSLGLGLALVAFVLFLVQAQRGRSAAGDSGRAGLSLLCWVVLSLAAAPAS